MRECQGELKTIFLRKQLLHSYRKLRTIFGHHGCPTERSIRRLLDQFDTKYTLDDLKPSSGCCQNCVATGVCLKTQIYRFSNGTVNWPLDNFKEFFLNIGVNDSDEFWFQQDGNMVHISADSINLLNPVFDLPKYSQICAKMWLKIEPTLWLSCSGAEVARIYIQTIISWTFLSFNRNFSKKILFMCLFF